MNNQLEDEVAKGRRAQAFVSEFVDPFMKESIDTLFRAFQDLPLEDVDKVLECKRLLRTLEIFKQNLDSFIDTGNLASASLSEKQ